MKKENFKAEIIFNVKCPSNYQPLFARIIIFIGYCFLPNRCTSEVCFINQTLVIIKQYQMKKI